MNSPPNIPFQLSSEDVSDENSLSKIRFGSSIKTKVSLCDDETIPVADREYGCLRANHFATPFPMKNKPIDTAALSARLEAEHRMSRRSITSNKSMKPLGKSSKHFDELDEYCEFSKQRKQFDKGEFTICMGHKLGDDFHPLKNGPQNMHSFANRLESKIYDSKFEEMAATYMAQHRSGLRNSGGEH